MTFRPTSRTASVLCVVLSFWFHAACSNEPSSFASDNAFDFIGVFADFRPEEILAQHEKTPFPCSLPDADCPRFLFAVGLAASSRDRQQDN